MKFKKLIIVVLIFILSYCIVLLNPKTISNIVQSFSISSIGILAGLLIGAIGVFLGSLGNLYTLIQIKTEISFQALSNFLKFIHNVVCELKQNVLFVVFSIAAILLIILLKGIDLPNVRWPISIKILTKEIFLTSIILCLIVLVFIAIIDSVKAMFRLHSIYEELIQDTLKRYEKISSNKD